MRSIQRHCLFISRINGGFSILPLYENFSIADYIAFLTIPFLISDIQGTHAGRVDSYRIKTVYLVPSVPYQGTKCRIMVIMW